MKKLIISYFPCFYPDQSLLGVDLGGWDEEKFREYVDGLGLDIIVHGVLWANYPFEKSDNQEPTIIPILMIDRMREVVDHLVYWSEGVPEEWFTLCFGSKSPNDYAVALMPDLQRSIQRQEFAARSVGDFEYIILFQSLCTVCHGNTLTQVKTKLRDSVPVGFVDINDVDRENPMSLDPDLICVLGPFKVELNPSGFNGSYLDNLYKEFEENPGAPPKFKSWNLHNN